MSKFKYPVSMVVTKEQFETDLRKPLEELGYDLSSYDYIGDTLCTNMDGKDEELSNLDISLKSDHRRHFIDHYNPDLFIALASMREGDEPHVGEWFVHSNTLSSPSDFIEGKLYQLIGDFNDFGAFRDERNKKNGYTPNNDEYFKKATKEQILQFFTKNKQSEMKGELIGYKLIKPEYREVALKISQTVGNWENSLMPYDISITQKGYIKRLTEAGVLDLWFEPCYKQEERFLTVNCDQGQFSVKRTEDGYEFEGKVISLPYLKALRNKMNGYDTVNGWNIAFAHVSIGCKSGISIMELQKLIDQHSQNAF